MKRSILLLGSLTLSLFLVAGCHAQVTPNPTSYTCPASTGTVYVALNASSPVTALTYKDTSPGAGEWCYIAQSQNNAVTPALVSLPSNTAIAAVTGTESVTLSWQAPTSGAAPTGYVLSRAAATAVTITAPSLGTPAVASLTFPTLLPDLPVVAAKDAPRPAVGLVAASAR
jgi:hypothetical protein